MITGLALIAAPAGVAFAADATADASPMATMDGAAAPAAAPVQQLQLRATADAAADTTASTSEIVVTGSRIPQPNLTSISPIQAVGHQEFQLEGHTDVIDLLNNLPQNFQNNTTDFSNTGNPLASPGGITTADLRGLGPQRTLVLVNGRRLGVGDANTGNPNPAPDLDQIPAAMIDHVEVLTGGASATYGSDAIAGVVNFILRKDFEGIEIDGTLGADQNDAHDAKADAAIRSGIASGTLGPLALPGDAFDGQNEDFSVILGSNSPDGKGNVTGYLEYHHQSPVLMKDRDFSVCQYVAGAPGACTGSPNSNLFDFALVGNLCAASSWGNIAPGSCSVVGNNFVNGPPIGSSPPAYFNSNNYEYLSRGDTRYIAGFLGHYEVSKSADVYAEFNFMDDHTREDIAPSGLFFGGNPFDPNGAGGWSVNCGNPFLSTGQAASLGCTGLAPTALVDLDIGRRNIEGGPRISTYDHFNYRGVLGVRGDFGPNDAWHYDAYGSYYYTFLYQANSNYLSNSKIGNALDVRGTRANPVCQSVLDGTDTACVPYNIFETGGVTAAALNYLNIIGTESGSVTEQIVESDLTGDLGKYGIKSPWAEDGIGISGGVDWRRDQLDFVPDAIVGSGDLSGGAGVGATIDKGLGVWEAYGETRIPILQKMPFAEDLEFDAGFRFSDYDTGPKPWTYKFGVQWSPVEDFRLRASYQRAIRAPNILELFNPVTVTQSNQFGKNGDPCAGTTPLFSQAQCALTGVPAALYGTGAIKQCPADQCNVSTGGNPDLAPEQADTYSVGGTFQPHWVRGLTLSIDWWDIKENLFVGTIPPNIIVTQCATTGQLCDLIHRAPATSNLFGPSDLVNGGFVIGTGQNIAGGEAEGIDFQGDYRMDLEDFGVQGWGSLNFDFNGSYMLKNTTDLEGVGSFDCAGLFGSKCTTVNPTWRHTVRLTWNTPWNVLASLQWRYIGAVDLDTNSSQPLLSSGFDPLDAHIAAFNYLDLAGAWRVNSMLTVRAGINNILDNNPPLIDNSITGTGTPNTYPTYDLLGREMFMSATVKF